jgi:hypothetical protein
MSIKRVLIVSLKIQPFLLSDVSGALRYKTLD